MTQPGKLMKDYFPPGCGPGPSRSEPPTIEDGAVLSETD